MFKNIQIKIASLVLASLFWLFVIASVDQVKTFNYDISAEPINLSDNLTILNQEALPKTKIYYRPTSRNVVFNDLSIADFSVTVQMEGLLPGTYTAPINVSANHPDIEITNYTPKEMTFTLEKIIEKELPVETKAVGSVSVGYRIDRIDNNINSIRISGAESIISRTSKAVAEIKMYGSESTDQTKEASIILYDNLDREIPKQGLRVTPNSINLDILIKPDEETKTVGIIPNLQKISLQDGYFIKSVSIEPPTANIRGKTDVIKNIEFLETIRLTINNLDKDYKTDLDLELPEKISLISPENNKVHLSLQVESLDYQREVEAKIMVKNMPNGYFVENDIPILVTLTGDPQSLDSIDENDISVNLDYNDINPYGEIRYELRRQDFIYPQNTTIVEFSPKILEFKIVR